MYTNNVWFQIQAASDADAVRCLGFPVEGWDELSELGWAASQVVPPDDLIATWLCISLVDRRPVPPAELPSSVAYPARGAVLRARLDSLLGHDLYVVSVSSGGCASAARDAVVALAELPLFESAQLLVFGFTAPDTETLKLIALAPRLEAERYLASRRG